jgi:hypothetical protein
MFDYWRANRKLRRQFAAFEKRFERMTREQKDMSVVEYREEYSRFLRALKLNQNSELVHKAYRLGINVFTELPEDWVELPGGLVSREGKEPSLEFPVLSIKGNAKLWKMVRDKQYEIAKKWTDLLAPIFSTIISIIALIIAIIALKK